MATFTLKGEARNWWEALKRQLIAPLPGVVPAVPQVVTWERFVRGFNDQYCPKSDRLEQEATFTHLEQGTMTIPEYEARFAALSRYAPEMVDTDANRCKQFRQGLNLDMCKRLITFRERDYADLVDMARKTEKSMHNYRDKQESNKKSKRREQPLGDLVVVITGASNRGHKALRIKVLGEHKVVHQGGGKGNLNRGQANKL